MKKTKIEIDNRTIINAGLQSLTDFYAAIAKDKLDLPGLSAFKTGIESPFLNPVIDRRVNNDSYSELIQPLTHFFNHQETPWGWFTISTDIKNDLFSKGFSLIDESPGMYLDLKDIPLAVSAEDVQIKVVDPNDNLEDWIQPVREGFASKDNCKAYHKLNVALLKKGEKKLRHFTAYYKGKIAGSATLFSSQESVMLHNLATKIALRGQGIGTMLVFYILNVAKEAGYRHCFLDATEASFNIYKKIGFRVYYIMHILAKGQFKIV